MNSSLVRGILKFLELIREGELIKAEAEIFDVAPAERLRDASADLGESPRIRHQWHAVISHPLDKCPRKLLAPALKLVGRDADNV
ncbi:hypothetical protein NicSoilC5_18280 [Arthrobacter sp. NicSoilC5]|nr:hypothetical protein NicSoilC5_18280 [Arthrobacter sp. NicSoilC5]